MAYTATYSFNEFNSNKSVLYITVYIVNELNSIVEVVPSFPVKLPIDSNGNAPTGPALEMHVDSVISAVYSPKVLAEKKGAIENGGPGVSNADALYALTQVVEGAQNVVPIVAGIIRDTNGVAVEGVTISDGTASGTSNTNGYYYFESTTGPQNVTASKSGYIDTLKLTTVPTSGIANVDFTLTATLGVQSSVNISGLTSGEVTATNTGRASNNAEIVFPQNALLSGGSPVDSATVDIANITVSDPGALDTFPGYFIGDDSGFIDPIETFGFINVNLPSGVTLDPGVGATIRLPVDPDPGDATFPVWRLDEATGVWERTGTATRVGSTNVFEFTVTTFSWYNLDKPLASQVTMNLTAYDSINSSDVATEGVEITVRTDAGGANWQGRGVTDSNGQLSMSIPAGLLTVSGKKGSKRYETSGYTDNGDGTIDVDVKSYVYTPAPILAQQGGGGLVQTNVLITALVGVGGDLYEAVEIADGAYTVSQLADAVSGNDIVWTDQANGIFGISIFEVIDNGDGTGRINLGDAFNLGTFTAPGTMLLDIF